MKMKSYAVLAVSGVLAAASLAYITPAFADDMNDNGQSMQPMQPENGAPQDNNLALGNTGNALDGSGMQGGNSGFQQDASGVQNGNNPGLPQDSNGNPGTGQDALPFDNTGTSQDATTQQNTGNAMNGMQPDTGNHQGGADMNNNPGALDNPGNSSGSNNDQGGPDTATGDDDY